MQQFIADRSDINRQAFAKVIQGNGGFSGVVVAGVTRNNFRALGARMSHQTRADGG